MTHLLKQATLPFLGVLIAMSIATLAGCASSDTSTSRATPANVNGTWTGGTAAGGRTYTLVLKQSGANVTGTLSGAGTLDGPIEGTVDGNTIRLRERSGFGSTPMLNVQGDQITGILGGTTLNMRRTKQ
jgi:hypothetical protein